MTFTRRQLLSASGGFCIYALLAELHAASSPGQIPLPFFHWVSQQSELAGALAAGELSALQWHAAVNALAAQVDLEELARELRKARIRSAGAPFGHDPQKRIVTLLDDDGNPRRLGYALAIFDFTPDSVITPHAHQNMASAHMVLEGRVRVRTFDRIADHDGAMTIHPRVDVVAEPGYAAAMTTERENIHWFTPKSPRAMTLDVIITGLDPAQPPFTIQPVDPLGGVTLRDGTIKAPLMSFEQSMMAYHAGL